MASEWGRMLVMISMPVDSKKKMKYYLLAMGSKKLLLIIFVAWVLTTPGSGDPVWGEKVILRQPGGLEITGYIYGDEFHQRIETAEGYTIICNETTGMIEYAILKENRLAPSGFMVGIVSPSFLESINFPKHQSDRRSVISELRQKSPEVFNDFNPAPLSAQKTTEKKALEGVKKVFAVCIDFKPEENPPTQWSSGTYFPLGFGMRLFSTAPGEISMSNYYRANSYQKFWPVGTIYPDWVTLPQKASDYKKNGSWKKVIEDALDLIKSRDPFFDFKQHADGGYLDIILIWAGTRETWGTFFWPKKGSVSLNKYEVTVRHYNVVNERNSRGEENTGIGTFCHEYGHMTGSPDLYDYSEFQNRPLGMYCIMGWSNSEINFSGYIKWKIYGWVEPVEIKASGDFLIDALAPASASNPRLYKIDIDHPEEYLLLENRQDGADPIYENYPGRRSGLLITHVDEGYPPAACLPDYAFYGVEAIVPCLDPAISALPVYATYWGKMTFSADYGFTQVGPSYPDDALPGSYLTLVSVDDEENVIYRNTRGHRYETDIQIQDIGWSGSTMGFTVAMKHFVLTINSGEGGTTDPGPGSHAYYQGRQVEVEASEDKYWIFTEWTGDILSHQKDQNKISILMNGNKSVFAYFRKINKPADFSGRRVLNRSLSQAEYINILSWKEHPQNQGLNLKGYRLYQVEKETRRLLEEFGPDSFEFWHRKVKKDEPYAYALVSVSQKNKEGEPAYLVVQ